MYNLDQIYQRADARLNRKRLSATELEAKLESAGFNEFDIEETVRDFERNAKSAKVTAADRAPKADPFQRSGFTTSDSLDLCTPMESRGQLAYSKAAKHHIDRHAHPKKKPSDFAFAYEHEGFYILTDTELDATQVEAAVNCAKHQRFSKPIVWVEVIVDGADVLCGYHTEEINPASFEHIRRITGYLVGTLDRFNNGKAAEERDRVKHKVA